MYTEQDRNDLLESLAIDLNKYSVLVNSLNPKMKIKSYKLDSIKEFTDSLHFEEARLAKNKDKIKEFYDKYLINEFMYNDWLAQDLEACN